MRNSNHWNIDRPLHEMIEQAQHRAPLPEFAVSHRFPALPALPRAALALAMLQAVPGSSAAEPPPPSPLAGTWTLVAADAIRPDGSRIRDYGESPRGLLIVDAAGRYSLQIYRSERPRFAAGDKAAATPAEFASAVLGSSTHVGTVAIDAGAQTLDFRIESASFPNWEGTVQKRRYELTDDALSYRVTVQRADGSVPISVWKRLR